jgi:hypothetical protein
MKVGDLVQFRDGWIRHPTTDEVITPRPDDSGWSTPCLVVEEWEGMWIVLYKGHRTVLSSAYALTEVRVLNEG